MRCDVKSTGKYFTDVYNGTLHCSSKFNVFFLPQPVYSVNVNKNTEYLKYIYMAQDAENLDIRLPNISMANNLNRFQDIYGQWNLQEGEIQNMFNVS